MWTVHLSPVQQQCTCSDVLNLAACLGICLSLWTEAIEAHVELNKSRGYFSLFKINARSQLKVLLVKRPGLILCWERNKCPDFYSRIYGKALQSICYIATVNLKWMNVFTNTITSSWRQNKASFLMGNCKASWSILNCTIICDVYSVYSHVHLSLPSSHVQSLLLKSQAV